MAKVLQHDPRQPDTALHHRLTTILSDPDLRAFRAVVAYVRWQGLAVIASALEGFLERGGRVETIYGCDNGVTTPDALTYASHLRTIYGNYEFAGVVRWDYANSIFHPKLFQFDFDAGSRAIVGSANLTGGGLIRNHELGVEIEMGADDPSAVALEQAWTTYRGDAESLTDGVIRDLKRTGCLASEPDAETRRRGAVVFGSPLPTPPLFKHILSSRLPGATKYALLASADSLSVKPRKLYLQVLGETGGGHQVQLPVATLGSFFGVGHGVTKPVTFSFPNERVEVSLTHFDNNTHRVRLRPLQTVARPAVLVFERLGDDRYGCRVVPPSNYANVLASKCPEQTRSGSRRWGLEE